MPEKINFTKRRIDALPLPEKGKRSYYYDARINGLVLQITGSGTRTFQVYKKLNAKPLRVTLGRYPGMTIEQARNQAQIKLAELAGGINPNQKRKAEKAAAITLGEVFEDYLNARKSLKPGTIKDYHYIMEREAFPGWLDKPMKDITRDMIAGRHAQLGQRSEARSNVAMRLMRALFYFAQGQYENDSGETLFPDNPVRRISHTRAWYQVDRRRTVIKTHELKPWHEAVLSLTERDGPQAETVRDYLVLLLFTGLRRAEAAKLKWPNVDFQAKTLKVEDTKNKEPLTLPLSDFIFDMLARRKLHGNGVYVFEGSGTKSGYLEYPAKAIKKVRERSGIYFAPHDLRRTFATITESLDISSYAVKRLLNHKMSGDVTAGYIVHDVERLRDPMQQITDYILKNVGAKPTAEIIDMHGRAAAE